MDIKIVNLNSPKKNKINQKGNQEMLTIENYGEYESLRGSLKIQSNIKSSRDGWVIYHINKDGSGQMLKAFGKKVFPAGTFSETYDFAKKIYESKRENIYSYDDVNEILCHIRNQIEQCDSK